MTYRGCCWNLSTTRPVAERNAATLIGNVAVRHQQRSCALAIERTRSSNVGAFLESRLPVGSSQQDRGIIGNGSSDSDPLLSHGKLRGKVVLGRAGHWSTSVCALPRLRQLQDLHGHRCFRKR